jgi:hypothetical protein
MLVVCPKRGIWRSDSSTDRKVWTVSVRGEELGEP